LSVHVFVRLEPLQGKAMEFREHLLRVIGLTRNAVGCLGIRAFESLREPTEFTIPDCRTRFQFLAAAKELLSHPVQGFRSREIGES
jgi:hypothetical protein